MYEVMDWRVEHGLISKLVSRYDIYWLLYTKKREYLIGLEIGSRRNGENVTFMISVWLEIRQGEVCPIFICKMTDVG